jgi:hypothetical protein
VVGKGEKRRTNRFLCNQWQWSVISPNSRKLDLVEYLLRYSKKTMELGSAPPFFWSRSTVELLELGVFG